MLLQRHRLANTDQAICVKGGDGDPLSLLRDAVKDLTPGIDNHGMPPGAAAGIMLPPPGLVQQYRPDSRWPERAGGSPNGAAQFQR